MRVVKEVSLEVIGEYGKDIFFRLRRKGKVFWRFEFGVMCGRI